MNNGDFHDVNIEMEGNGAFNIYGMHLLLHICKKVHEVLIQLTLEEHD